MITQPLLSDTKLDKTLAKRAQVKATVMGICIFVLFLVAQNFVAVSG